MESPLLYNLQDDELKSHFDQLYMALRKIRSNSSAAKIVAFSERVCREVTAKPNLARIVSHDAFFLWYAYTIADELFHPAIKCLIETNPSALLVWESLFIARGDVLVHKIARHRTHCVLMPWIAANYQWVLDHERCLADPPVFDVLHHYAFRGGESVPTGCTATIIQQFFEAYPQGLTQVDDLGLTPLHSILFGTAECEADLFIWMAEQCPINMLKTRLLFGRGILHFACRSLVRHLGDDSSKICKYLIAKCTESVRIMGKGEYLPIHLLLRACQHRLVKEVAVCLLREHPESYDMKTATRVALVPSYIPFIQRIKPLLDEEKQLEESIVYLQEVSGVFQDAVKGTDNPSQLASSTCDAFANWATVSFVHRLDARLEQVSTELQDECNAEEEHGREHETDE